MYRDVWTAAANEELHCRRESLNAANPFAVDVVKEGTTVRDSYFHCSRLSTKNATFAPCKNSPYTYAKLRVIVCLC